MQKINLLTMLAVVAISLVLVTTQAIASSPTSPSAGPKKTPGPPGLLGLTQTPGPPGNYGDPLGPGLQNQQGGPPSGQPGPHGKHQVYHGTISALNASSLTLTLRDGGSIDIALDDKTRIRVPGPKAEGDTLALNMKVVVRAITDGSGKLVARAVMAIPGKPLRAHRVGTVTAYTAGTSITIEAIDGQTYTFKLTADTKIRPEERASLLVIGARVTVIAPRDPSNAASLDLTAIGIVVHPAKP